MDEQLNEEKPFGNKDVYCSGKIITGPDRAAFWATQLLIGLISALFYVFVCVPDLNQFHYYYYLAIGVYLNFLIEVTLFLCTFTEPGIIPRAKYFRPSDEGQVKMTMVKSYRIEMRYCNTCKIFRPPRAHHCKYCDNCIDSFDHHCPWIGNCIGKRNYRYFLMFIWSVTITLLYAIALSIHRLVLLSVAQEMEILAIVAVNPGICAVILLSIVVFICMMSVVPYHFYLLCTGQTTYEAQKSNVNPWNEGCCKNMNTVFCRSVPHSLLDGRVQRAPLIPVTDTNIIDD